MAKVAQFATYIGAEAEQVVKDLEALIADMATFLTEGEHVLVTACAQHFKDNPTIKSAKRLISQFTLSAAKGAQEKAFRPGLLAMRPGGASLLLPHDFVKN